MRIYEKAIIIDEPWISKILTGEKVWELRSTRTIFRGPVALIRKGSGAVIGTATLVDCLAPLSSRNFALHENRHCIPSAAHQAALERGRCIPWVLRDVRTLRRPVSYGHRSGQQIWVRLEPATDRAIQCESENLV
jgi:hypothetical protein